MSCASPSAVPKSNIRSSETKFSKILMHHYIQFHQTPSMSSITFFPLSWKTTTSERTYKIWVLRSSGKKPHTLRRLALNSCESYIKITRSCCGMFYKGDCSISSYYISWRGKSLGWVFMSITPEFCPPLTPVITECILWLEFQVSLTKLKAMNGLFLPPAWLCYYFIATILLSYLSCTCRAD